MTDSIERHDDEPQIYGNNPGYATEAASENVNDLETESESDFDVDDSEDRQPAIRAQRLKKTVICKIINA